MDDKLAQVRAQANELGITYHHRASAATIQANINAFLAGQTQAKPKDSLTMTSVRADGPPPYESPLTESQFMQASAAQHTKGNAALVRVRIQNMNPTKKDWKGEIISVGSAKLGTFKKFIPFNTGEPWHVPRIMLEAMRDKKCSQFYTAGSGKSKTRKSKLVNEYVIEELPPLTVQELKDLALQQAMANGKEA